MARMPQTPHEFLRAICRTLNARTRASAHRLVAIRIEWSAAMVMLAVCLCAVAGLGLVAWWLGHESKDMSQMWSSRPHLMDLSPVRRSAIELDSVSSKGIVSRSSGTGLVEIGQRSIRTVLRRRDACSNRTT